jgi:hypothetical protein
MARVPTIGEELPATDLLIKRNSYTLIADVKFWDDEEETVPADLVADGITGQIELVDPTGGPTIIWTGTPTGNRLVFQLTSTQTNVTWDYTEGVMVLFQSGERRIINYLYAKVQG